MKFNQLYEKIITEWSDDPSRDWDRHVEQEDARYLQEFAESPYASSTQNFTINLRSISADTFKILVDGAETSITLDKAQAEKDIDIAGDITLEVEDFYLYFRIGYGDLTDDHDRWIEEISIFELQGNITAGDTIMPPEFTDTLTFAHISTAIQDFFIEHSSGSDVAEYYASSL